jgi:hypothetical protein
MQPNRRYSALSPSMKEYFTQGLYDTVNYAAAGQPIMNFFAIPLGQPAVLTTAAGLAPAAGTIKTYRDTNMEVAGFVPDKTYQFSGMSVYFRRLNAAVLATADIITDDMDKRIIVGSTWWHFRIGDKDVLYVPFAFVPVMNPTVMTTWAGNTIANNGGRSAMYGFPTPITVEPGQVIRVTLEAGAPAPIVTTLDISLMLHAEMERPA